jgi:hypothetical protein
MKKKIILSLATVAFIAGTVGCGGGGSTTNDGNVSNPSGGNPGGNQTVQFVPKLEISKDLQANDYTVDYTHGGKGKGVFVFINSDNNINTGNIGYSGNEGAEFQIYKFDNTIKLQKVDETNNSKWIDMNLSDYVEYTPGTKKDTILLKNDLLKDDYFTITTLAVDSGWNEVNGTRVKKIFDIKLASGNPTTINGDSNLSLKIESNTTNISMKLIGNEYTDYTKIFIDTDENNNTGYNPAIWSNLGADYMISHGKLYTRKSDNSDWDYDNIKELSYIIKDSINFDIKKSDLGNPNSIIVGVGVYDSEEAWQTTHVIPERNATAVVHTYNF